jgi:hypothetical protein
VKKPYENQLIGAFVFALGLRVGKRPPTERKTSFGVNLFQQTPLDRVGNDGIFGDERCFVIEFKRGAEELPEEGGKWPPGASGAFLSDRKLRTAADRAHFVVYGERNDDVLAARFCTYIDVLEHGRAATAAHRPAEELISDLVASNFGQPSQRGLPHQALSDYLDSLWALKYGKSSSGSSSSEAWLGVVQGKDGVSIVVANSLAQLMGHEPEPAPESDAKFGTSSSSVSGPRF